MHPALQQNTFLVKEHVGMFKAANNFDIFNPETGETVLQCREDKLGFITKMLRFSDLKPTTPFDVIIKAPDGTQVVRVKRGISVFMSKVEVLDGNNITIGYFKQKVFSIGGAFTVLDASEAPICELKGKWTGWEFRFKSGEKELALVTKKWAGVGKELFTSADNYILKISDDVPADDVSRQLILAAVMVIDMVLTER